MAKLTSNYVGGYSLSEAAADAKAIKLEERGIATGRFKKSSSAVTRKRRMVTLGKLIGLGVIAVGLILLLVYGAIQGLVRVGIFFGLNFDETMTLAKFGVFIFLSIIFFGIWFAKKKIMAYPMVKKAFKELIQYAPSLADYKTLKFTYYLLTWLTVGAALFDDLWFLSDQAKKFNALWPGDQGYPWMIVVAAGLGILGPLLVVFIGFKNYLISILCGVFLAAEIVSVDLYSNYTYGPLTSLFSYATLLIFGCLLLQSFGSKFTRR